MKILDRNLVVFGGMIARDVECAEYPSRYGGTMCIGALTHRAICNTTQHCGQYERNLVTGTSPIIRVPIVGHIHGCAKVSTSFIRT